MVSTRLPTAWGLIAAQRNVAVDAALVEVLPSLDAFAQRAAFETSLKRAHTPSLTRIVAGFHDAPEEIRHLTIAHVHGLSAGIRTAITSSRRQARISAIELIVRSGCGRLAYLLTDTLHSKHGDTHFLAAKGLRWMTQALIDRLPGSLPAEQVADFSKDETGLAEALGSAVQCWERHLQTCVLEAALWMGEQVESDIRCKLEQRRTKITHALNHLLEQTDDPRMAGFVWRALTMPVLRSSAARTIGGARRGEFIRAFLSQTWLLADPRIARPCRWIHQISWLGGPREGLNPLDGGEVLHELDDDELLASGVRLLAVTGGPREGKIEHYRRWIGEDRPRVHQAVLWQLVEDASDGATELLQTMAVRFRGPIGRVAERELFRRGVKGGLVTSEPQSLSQDGNESEARGLFDRYWCLHSQQPSAELEHIKAILQKRPEALCALLRGKLASRHAADRIKALGVTASLDMMGRLEEQLYRLAHDPDPMVRSVVIRLLIHQPGATTLRILRAAVHDPDERVQANAVEALDRLDAPDRHTVTEPKLKSPHSRVRANAVKSLLRMEMEPAGETLLAMLEGSSRAHRLSALWVIERLNLRSLLRRVILLSEDDDDPQLRRRAQRVLRSLSSGEEDPKMALTRSRTSPRPQPTRGAS